jgi:cytochrome P450
LGADKEPQKSTPNFEKSPIFIGAVSPLDGQTGISLANNVDHTRQRRALAAPFTNRALLQQQGILQVHVDKLIAALKAKARNNEAANLGEWCACPKPTRIWHVLSSVD